MRWVDLCGCPGAGKSTIAYPIWKDKEVGWDGLPPPAYWKPFLDEVTNLCGLVQDHASFVAVLRMNDRSIKKMATVERMDDVRPNDPRQCFIQTGLVQRILGFGWRLQEMGRDINLIRRALWLMPVSVGVAFLEADLATLLARNRARRPSPNVRGEDRSHQVPFMLACIPLVKEVLRERGIPTIAVDVQHQSVAQSRAQLLEFADCKASDAAQMRRCRQMALS